MGELGKLNGKSYVDYVDDIKNLKRNNNLEEAEKLLLQLIDVVELEANAKKQGVAPWYYEQLAIIYTKLKQKNKAIEILERFALQKHAPGSSPPKLIARLEKLKKESI